MLERIQADGNTARPEGFQPSALSRAWSFCSANRWRSAREAVAGPMMLTSVPVAASIAETFTLLPIAVNSK